MKSFAYTGHCVNDGVMAHVEGRAIEEPGMQRDAVLIHLLAARVSQVGEE